MTAFPVIVGLSSGIVFLVLLVKLVQRNRMGTPHNCDGFCSIRGLGVGVSGGVYLGRLSSLLEALGTAQYIYPRLGTW